MGGIEDYIKWRGDLTFEQSAFNEVDKDVYKRQSLCIKMPAEWRRR